MSLGQYARQFLTWTCHPLYICTWRMVCSGGLRPPLQQHTGLRFAAACLASLLATFVNPYGWHLHEHVVAYLQNGYLMDHIAEFRSFSFHSPGALYIELFLLVAVLGARALLRQRAFG